MSQFTTGTYMGTDNMPKNLFGYEVIDFIGEGAGSVIYAVTQPESGQIYALKHVIRKFERTKRMFDSSSSWRMSFRSVRNLPIQGCGNRLM
jgi:hypothetical protein